ncbi:MAG: hypothetical protein VB106_07150 [Clostridiaceae bacterium]|nr:hypothetical protein [Clostridiaceae bacterium]
MEEKVLGILEQLQNQLKDMKAGMATKEDLAGMATKKDIAGMATKEDLAGMATKEDISKIEGDIRRLEGALFRFENKAESKFNALFDGYKQNTEAIYELREDVKSLKATVEKHEVKLKIVK